MRMGTVWHVCIVLGVLSMVTLRSLLDAGAIQEDVALEATVYKFWATPPEFPSASTILISKFVPKDIIRYVD
jgi:hypothetical protein